MNEIGPAGIPLNVVTKAAEIQLLDVVDKVLLGNKWLRKAAGIQPQFPYVVDSFEERCADAMTCCIPFSFSNFIELLLQFCRRITY